MNHVTILKRIRGLFAPDASEHFDSIRDAFERATQREPVQPMSDHELARAIREFRSAPACDRSLAKLSRRRVETSGPKTD